MDEHDPRPYQAIKIDMASSESGIERFQDDGLYMPPDTSAWRCNLTAMSQRYNLYFVARISSVAVYTPDFPFQKLGTTPKLLIPATLAEPAAPGYIDPQNPHAINNLMVGDLGNEEILLLATDSGNVTAYHTKSINEAVEKDPYRFNSEGRSDTAGLRAFWSQWVRESAWGLAIHTEARMIAVSANVPHLRRVRPVDFTVDPTATITVFAFALSDESPTEVGESPMIDTDIGLNESDWADWISIVSDSRVVHRNQNYRIVLSGETGHHSNIPSISFVNTRQDPEGLWLLSTDISGVMKMWQIWAGTCRRSWHFGTDEFNMIHGHLDEEAGWMVAVLDPESFRPARTMASFCGYSAAPKYVEKGGESYDLTRIVRLTVPGRSHRHPFLEADREAGDTFDDSSDSSSDEEAEEAADHFSDDEDNLEPAAGTSLVLPDMAAAQPIPPTTSPTATEPDADAILTHEQRQRSPQEARDIEDILLDVYQNGLQSPEDSISNDSDMGDLDDRHAGDESDQDEARSTSAASFASETSLSHVTQRSSVDVEIEPLSIASPTPQSPRLSPSNGATVKKRRRKGQEVKDDDSMPPNIPTLHCTTSHLRLINVPKARMPHLFCGNILEQYLPRFWRGQARALRRLNMLQQIPELGIVIIASQFGRCAVCALTRHPRSGCYGLRVDWVLPTKRQEKSGQRPGLWLLGIATAPVQGHLLEADASTPPTYAWGKDFDIDGTKVTFDPDIVALPDRKEHASDSDGEVSTQRSAKRPRRDSTSSMGSSSSGASTLQRPWRQPQAISSTRRLHDNRRYRLMLTYADQTVLTYEISRPVGPDSDESAVNDA